MIPTAVVLLLVGLCILMLEVFIPSAGLLFFIASICIIASLATAFMHSPAAGTLFVVIVAVLAVVLPGILFKLWKKSPVGKRMFLPTPVEADPEGNGAAPPADVDNLLGKTGKTVTPLRPSGMTEFNGRRVDTVAEGVMIERGEIVRVVAVQGNRIVVRRVDPD